MWERSGNLSLYDSIWRWNPTKNSMIFWSKPLRTLSRPIIIVATSTTAPTRTRKSSTRQLRHRRQSRQIQIRRERIQDSAHTRRSQSMSKSVTLYGLDLVCHTKCHMGDANISRVNIIIQFDLRSLRPWFKSHAKALVQSRVLWRLRGLNRKVT